VIGQADPIRGGDSPAGDHQPNFKLSVRAKESKSILWNSGPPGRSSFRAPSAIGFAKTWAPQPCMLHAKGGIIWLGFYGMEKSGNFMRCEIRDAQSTVSGGVGTVNKVSDRLIPLFRDILAVRDALVVYCCTYIIILGLHSLLEIR